MKILLIRFSSIGDIVLTSPVIRCLNQQIPGVELHFLTKLQYSTFVGNNPNIHKVLAYNGSLKLLVKELKNEKYDLIIDLHKSLRSRAISRQLSVKTITYHKLNVKKWLYTALKVNKLPKEHLVDRYFKAIKPLKIKNDHLGLDYFIPDSTQIESHLPDKYICFSIGGTYTTKKLPNTKIKAIIEKLKLPIVLIGGQEDIHNASLIEQTTHFKCINLVGQLSIDQSALIIKNASHVISHDTGMMHIAAAFKKPLSVIWGNTHPALGMYPYGYEDNIHLVQMHQVDLKCRPCSKLGFDACPRKHFNCMNLQNVEEIVKNIESVEYTQ